ncbi:hypothetical protein [uncultured Sphingomonas sp.]|uniref:hypothetical protein n=1 Tax=uncultured Sphingomonas sp. TaxID=158754 RepID=UPI0035C9CE62
MRPRAPATWRVAFLRALARGLCIANAAREAGISASSVHAARRRDPAFAAAWVRARDRGVVRLSRAEPVLQPDEVVCARRDGRSRIQPAGHGRWSAGKEQLFLQELAATGNVRGAAAAVGMSTTALYARKAKWPGFADRWRAALREGWERLEEGLLRAAADTLDPPDTAPPIAGPAAPDRALFRDAAAMTIDQALILWKAHRAEAKGELDARNAGAARRRAEPSMDEVREEVLRRVRALGG